MEDFAGAFDPQPFLNTAKESQQLSLRIDKVLETLHHHFCKQGRETSKMSPVPPQNQSKKADILYNCHNDAHWVLKSHEHCQDDPPTRISFRFIYEGVRSFAKVVLISIYIQSSQN